MKINNLTLTNFRSFKDTQSIDFAKLTLLFGPNSVGKSTILLALFYLQHILKNGQCDPQRIDALGGKYVGGFKNLVHCRDLDKSITIKLEYDKEGAIGTTYGRTLTMLNDMENLDGSLLLLEDQASQTETVALEWVISWSESRQTAYVEKYSVWLNGEHLATTHSDAGLNNPLLEELKLAHPLLRTSDHDEWLDELNAEGFSSLLHREISSQMQFGFKSQTGALPTLGRVLETSLSLESTLTTAIINEALSEVLVAPLDDLLRYLDDSVCIGPLRKISDATYQPNPYPKQGDWYDGTACWDELSAVNYARDLSINRWLSPTHLGIGYQLAYATKSSADSYFLVDQPNCMEDMLALKSVLGDQIAFAVSRGNLSENPEAENQTVDNLNPKQLEIVAPMSGLYLGKEEHKNLSIVLWDTTLKLSVTSADVGVGVSQVVPLLVAAHKVNQGLVACEQPELHIHPRIQVGLGDVLTQPAGTRPFLTNPQYLIETHSEHLILRVLKRIRQTVDEELPEGFTQVKNTDVSILYLEPTEEGIVVRRIRIDEEGEFIDRWPHGFFSERREELM